MTFDQWIEGITHIGILLLYSVAAVVALVAHSQASQYSRRRSAIILFAMAFAWVLFYLFIAELWPFTLKAPPVLWSRLAHVFTASGILSLALLIISSERAQHEQVKMLKNTLGDDIG